MRHVLLLFNGLADRSAWVFGGMELLDAQSSRDSTGRVLDALTVRAQRLLSHSLLRNALARLRVVLASSATSVLSQAVRLVGIFGFVFIC